MTLSDLMFIKCQIVNFWLIFVKATVSTAISKSTELFDPKVGCLLAPFSRSKKRNHHQWQNML